MTYTENELDTAVFNVRPCIFKSFPEYTPRGRVLAMRDVMVELYLRPEKYSNWIHLTIKSAWFDLEKHQHFCFKDE